MTHKRPPATLIVMYMLHAGTFSPLEKICWLPRKEDTSVARFVAFGFKGKYVNHFFQGLGLLGFFLVRI